MKTETLGLLLLASIAHAFMFYACGTEERLFMFYACGTEERLCMSAVDCHFDREISAAREGESGN